MNKYLRILLKPLSKLIQMLRLQKTKKVAVVLDFMTLSYILVSHTSAIRLTRNEGHRLPVIAMEKMNIQENDKVLFLYYPKTHFTKYFDNSKYIANSIDKYNFPEVFDKGTTYDAFKSGHELYKVFF